MNTQRGVPQNVYSEPDRTLRGGQLVIPTSQLAKDRTIANYFYWSYDDSDGTRTDVDFNHKTNRVIRIACYSKLDENHCPDVWGLTTGATEDELTAKLGTPDSSSIDATTKTMRYGSLSLFFILEKKRVYMIGIGDREKAE